MIVKPNTCFQEADVSRVRNPTAGVFQWLHAGPFLKAEGLISMGAASFWSLQ